MSGVIDLLNFEFSFTVDDVIWLVAAILASFAFLVLFERFIRSLYIEGIGQKYVFITGCDTGFGRIAAQRLDKLGCHVFAGCLTEEGARGLKEGCSQRLMTVQLDVTYTESIRKARNFVQNSLPTDTGLWGLVNNAGVLGLYGPMNWFGQDDLQATFDINVFGMCDVTKQFLPLVKKAKGRIVNTSSIVGFSVIPYTGPYCMTKHAVEALSDAYRYELQPFGVSVHIIEPGVHRTPFMDETRLVASANALWEKQPAAVKTEYGEEYLKHAIWTAVDLTPRVGATDLNKVPQAYEHALFSSLPRKRYLVGYGSGIAAFMALLPSVCTDWVYRLPRLRNVPAACKK